MFLKLSFLWGVLGPLLGVLFGLRGATGCIVGTKVLRFLALGRLPVAATGIPTLFASWCWALEEKRGLGAVGVNVLVPLICFILFIFHPSVGYGWWYGLYWVVPMSLYVAQVVGVVKKNSFFTALRSTFIAHAVGSVIWCYTIPMSPERWLALIPLVATERLIMASGMAIVFRVASSSFWSSIILLPIRVFWKNGEKCWYATFGHDNGWQSSVGKRKKIASGNPWPSQGA